MTESPEEYLDAAPEVARPWLREFWDHVAERAPGLEPSMFRQVPMYKFGASHLGGYVMFTVATGHFSVHSLEFDLIAEAQKTIPGAFGGKGSVSVKYANEAAKPALIELVDAVLSRRGFADA